MGTDADEANPLALPLLPLNGCSSDLLRPKPDAVLLPAVFPDVLLLVLLLLVLRSSDEDAGG